MKGNAIIVFTKNPETGSVKTRLAATIGDDKAVLIYKHLVEQVSSVLASLSIPVYVFYTSKIPESDDWSSITEHRMLQSGEDLGTRMLNAFQHVFSHGFQRVCIVGCDTLDLKAQYIQNAFQQLETADVVIAPTYDGGYILLGLREIQPSIFLGMRWSVPSVFDETMRRLHALKLKTLELEKIRDIDVYDDLQYYPQLTKLLNDQLVRDDAP